MPSRASIVLVLAACLGGDPEQSRNFDRRLAYSIASRTALSSRP